jgi:hypothetical protein
MIEESLALPNLSKPFSKSTCDYLAPPVVSILALYDDVSRK